MYNEPPENYARYCTCCDKLRTPDEYQETTDGRIFCVYFLDMVEKQQKAEKQLNELIGLYAKGIYKDEGKVEI